MDTTQLTNHQLAAQVDEINRETISYLRAQAARAYNLVNTPGRQQGILNAFPDLGLVPVRALQTYGAFQGALAAIGAAEGLAAPNLSVFQPQKDGAVLYVAPPEAEPEGE